MSKFWKPHRQARSAGLAQSAGYQLKRGAVKPLLDIECSAGQAIEWVLQIPHPFSQDDGDLDSAPAANIARVASASIAVW